MSIATAFLTHINPAGPWNLSTIHPQTGRVESTVAKSPEYMDEWIARRNGHTNIYWTPNGTRYPSGWKGRVANKDLHAGHIAVVDVDTAYKKGESNDDVISRLLALGATDAVFSGGGVQGYFVLAEDVPKDLLQRMNQWLIEQAGGDIGTYTMERLVRVPGTWNLPNAKKMSLGRKAVLADVAFISDRRLDVLDLGQSPLPRRKGANLADIEPDLELDWRDVIHRYRLPEKLAYLIEHGQDSTDSKHGDRSRYVYSAVCWLIKKGVPDSTIGAILLAPDLPISDSLLDKGDDEAWRQMNRAIGRAHDEPDVVSKWERAAREFDAEIWDEVTRDD